MKIKAQAWSIDLIIGIIIFSVSVLVFFIYTINESNEADSNLESLEKQGELILNDLLSNGYPEDWNSLNVIKIGILDNDKINNSLLEIFKNIEYNETKQLFNTNYDYYLVIDSFEKGLPGTNKDSIDSLNLLKLTRFSIYNEEPVTIYLYIWESK